MPKIVLVHDFLAEYGGAERVVEALHELFPEAPLFVAFADLRNFGSKKAVFEAMDIRTTWLQYIPGVAKLRSPLRLFAPSAFAHLDLSEYDIVISSSNAYHAKSVRVPNGTHFCYCHTPPRSLYGYDAASSWKKNPLIKAGGQIINHFLRQTDFAAAQNIDQIIVNSETVAKRVKKYWRRSSTVIYPPVAFVDQNKDNKITPAQDRSYFLFVNRLNFAKHPELAVQACLDLDLPLKVVGTGPMLEELKEMVANQKGKKIEFLGSVSDRKLAQLYSHAQALLYPVIDEDFGIVPIEAMAFGTPVLAHYSGGPTETIIEGKTGLFFKRLDLASLKQTIEKFQESSFNGKVIAAHVQRFSVKNFDKKIMDLIKEHVKN
ncbi:MAG: glycosyltransferase [bacterium]|nr:glycosyltransferase [bacterium]